MADKEELEPLFEEEVVEGEEALDDNEIALPGEDFEKVDAEDVVPQKSKSAKKREKAQAKLKEETEKAEKFRLEAEENKNALALLAKHNEQLAKALEGVSKDIKDIKERPAPEVEDKEAKLLVELESKIDAAVEEDDFKTAFKLNKEIEKVKGLIAEKKSKLAEERKQKETVDVDTEKVTEAQTKLKTSFDAWLKKNPWFGVNKVATKYALLHTEEIKNKYNFDTYEDMLKDVSEEVSKNAKLLGIEVKEEKEEKEEPAGVVESGDSLFAIVGEDTKVTLTADEKKIARKMLPHLTAKEAEKAYAAQKAYIERSRG